MNLYFLIYEPIDKIRKLLEKLPYLRYGLIFHEDASNIVYIGFESEADSDSFLQLAEGFDIGEVTKDDFSFRFNKDLLANSILQGNERLLKIFRSWGYR